MSIAEYRRLDAIRLGTSGTMLCQLDDVTQEAQAREITEWLAGQAHPGFTAIMEMAPMLAANCKDLKSLLITEAMGSGGKAFTNVSSYFAKGAQVGVGKVARASTVHRRVLLTSAVGHVRSVRAQHGGHAVASLEVQALYDGTNLPFVYSGDVALPSNLTVAAYHTVGPAYLGDVLGLVGGIKEVTIDYGTQMIVESADGESYPTLVCIGRTEPSITIQLLDDLTFSAEVVAGVALDGSGAQIYFRHMANKGQRVANGTATHLRCTMANGMVIPVNARAGNDGSYATDTIRVKGIVASDSADPFTWAEAAIP